jgi:hypothetical protein
MRFLRLILRNGRLALVARSGDDDLAEIGDA